MSDRICRHCGRHLMCNEFRWCKECRSLKRRGKPMQAPQPKKPPEPIAETPEYFVAPPRKKHPPKEIFHCERCDRYTGLPLDDAGKCTLCQKREPDPTPAEIAAECAAIRAGWKEHQWASQSGYRREFAVHEVHDPQMHLD